MTLICYITIAAYSFCFCHNFLYFNRGIVGNIVKSKSKERGSFHGDENEGEVKGFTWSALFNEL